MSEIVALLTGFFVVICLVDVLVNMKNVGD